MYAFAAVILAGGLSGSAAHLVPPTLAAPAAAAPAGDLEQRIARAIARLQQPPYTERFILADVTFGEQRIFTEYSGDVSGRMVGVVAKEIACGLTESWPLDSLLAGLSKAQLPDGHFGKPQDLAREVVGDRDMPILWGNGRLLVGLVEAYQATKRPEALAMARKLGDYYLNADPYLDRPELVDKFGTYAAGFATCYFGGIEGLVGLWRTTRDGRYLDQAKRMADLMARTTKPGEQHSHGRLCALRGLLDLYEATGDRAYLQRVVDEDQVIQQRYLWPTGGISEMTVATFNRDEGCTEGDWLRLNLRLWRLTGDESYLDLAEATLKNELAVNQFPNGGFGHRVAILSGGKMDGYFPVSHDGTQEAYWCCSEHCPRALLNVSQYAVAFRGSDVYVNLYEPVDVRIPVAGDNVRIIVEPRQHGQQALVQVRPEVPARLRMHFRVPAWCSDFRISDADARRESGGRWIVDREWREGDAVEAAMPFRVLAYQDGRPLSPMPLNGISAPEPAAFLFLGPYLLGRSIDSGEATEVDAHRAHVEPDGLSVSVRSPSGTPILLRPIADLGASGGGFRVRETLIPR